MVWSILKCSATVWDPYLAKGIHQLEMVQCHAARFVFGDYSRDSSVTEMFQEQGWCPHADQWLEFQLSMFYKIVQELITIIPTDYIELNESVTQKCNTCNYKQLQTNTTISVNSFFPRTTKAWDMLEDAMVHTPSLESFRHSVHGIDNRKESINDFHML